jgi:hypothetical protein
MASLQDTTDKIREAVGADAGLGKTLKFNLKGEGFIHIDGGTVTGGPDPDHQPRRSRGDRRRPSRRHHRGDERASATVGHDGRHGAAAEADRPLSARPLTS